PSPAATPAPAPDHLIAPPTDAGPGRRVWPWLAACAFVVGGLVAVAMTRPEHGPAAEALAVAADEAELARIEAARGQPASIAIESAVDGAAVWLSLGPTPTRSMPLRADVVHDLRLELDGHRPL